MPETTIRQIVRNMVDAGEDESSIAAVIKRHSEIHPDRSPEIPPAPYTGPAAGVKPVSELEPDTFWGGVGKAFRSGDVLKAGLEGAGGFLRGAIADIPSTISAAISDAGEVLSDPLRIAREAPGAFREGLPALGRQFAETTAMAGADPEAFGRMMGQLTGQPLITEGVIRGAPMLKTPISKAAYHTGVAGAMEKVGGALSDARTPNIVPTTPRGLTARAAVKTGNAVGRPLARAGQNMRMRALGVEAPLDLAQRIPNTVRPPNPVLDALEALQQRRNAANNIPPVVEDPLDLAARGGGNTPGGPPTVPSEYIYPLDETPAPPIVESPNDLAARTSQTPGGGFSSRYQDIPFDPTTGEQMPPKPALGTLVRDKVPTIEGQMGDILQGVRDTFAKESNPTTQLPPPAYSLGSGAPPAQPRVSVKAPKTIKKPGPKAQETKPNTTPKSEGFEPSVDPKKELAGIDSERLKAALEKMKARDEGVDVTTGEITEPAAPTAPKKARSKFKNPFERFNNETGAVGRDIGPIIERQAAEKAARSAQPDIFDIGDASTPIDLGAALQDIFAPASNTAANVSSTPAKTAPKGVNPLRPTVPPGQVTNRQMFELSANRGAESAFQRPQAVVGDRTMPHEFGEDMLFTPEELASQPDVPKFGSPVENPFDPRTAPGGVVSEPTRSFADIQNRVFELLDKGTKGTLTAEELAEAQTLNKVWRDHPEFGNENFSEFDTARLKRLKNESEKNYTKERFNAPKVDRVSEPGPFQGAPTSFKKTPSIWEHTKRLWEDETGAVGKDISDIQAKNAANKKGAGDGKWSISHPSGKPIADITVTREDINAARRAGVPDGMDNAEIRNHLFEQKLEELAKDNGYTVNDLGRLQIKYHTQQAKAGSVEVKPKAPTQKSTPVGPQGKSFRVSDGDKHLGDITVTPAEVEEAMQAPELQDQSPDDISRAIYESKLEDLAAEHGIEDTGSLNIDTMNANQKKIRDTRPDIPEESVTKAPEMEMTDPETAWARDGDTGPIVREYERLVRTGAEDSRFKQLLPKSMRFGLDPKKKETWRGRLNDLIEATKEPDSLDLQLAAKRREEMDRFLEQARKAMGIEDLPDVKPLRNQDIGPPLKSSDYKIVNGRIVPKKRQN